ncbi:hypothetical protein MMC11_003094, partial [Xylographa trunciseda]|nr:hypothetical protein [Xylographa trunciseda]
VRSQSLATGSCSGLSRHEWGGIVGGEPITPPDLATVARALGRIEARPGFELAGAGTKNSGRARRYNLPVTGIAPLRIKSLESIPESSSCNARFTATQVVQTFDITPQRCECVPKDRFVLGHRRLANPTVQHAIITNTSALRSYNMPPHLHPRSRLTTSLFGTTLLVSFLVVGMPHILPCPAPRTEFADVEVGEDGRRRRRRRKPLSDSDRAVDVSEDKGESVDAVSEKEMMARRAHQCPVPKPGGRIGQVLGFTDGKKDE